MKTIDVISTFKEPLLTAFSAMIRGIDVQLTDEARQSFKVKANDDDFTKEFFIQSIHEDETLTVIDRNNFVLGGVKLTDIIP